MSSPLKSITADATGSSGSEPLDTLIDALCNFSDADFDATWMHLSIEEATSLANLLIYQLAASLSGKLLAAYLYALRSGEGVVLPPVKIRARHPLRQLPTSFPEAAPIPAFLYGDSVRWRVLKDEEPTTGIIIGRCFAYAHHRGGWRWQYLVWLSVPAAQVLADSAWEDDLEALP